VRRIVRAVIYATVHTNIRLTDVYINEQLDRALLDTEARQHLRGALGLDEPRQRELESAARVLLSRLG
jgi:hypothetical protein